MKLSCTSLGCSVEKPQDYCKECSHAVWRVNNNLTFNPMFGFSSDDDIDWVVANKFLEKLKDLDIGKASFVNYADLG